MHGAAEEQTLISKTLESWVSGKAHAYGANQQSLSDADALSSPVLKESLCTGMITKIKGSQFRQTARF